MFSRFLLASVVVGALGVVPAAAQDRPVAPVAVPAYTFDVGDLWHLVRHQPAVQDADGGGRRFLVFAPSIGSKPSTGLSLGLSGNMAFYKGGDAAATHISTLSGGVKITQKRQLTFGSRLALFTAN